MSYYHVYIINKISRLWLLYL